MGEKNLEEKTREKPYSEGEQTISGHAVGPHCQLCVDNPSTSLCRQTHGWDVIVKRMSHHGLDPLEKK